MKERADFHVHLGDRCDQDILNEASLHQVKVMAILDRGIVRTAHLRLFITSGKQEGMTVLPGVECLTEITYSDKIVPQELLGLGFDLNHPEIYRNFDPRGEIYSQKHQRKVEFQKSFLESAGFSLNHTQENAQQWQTINGGEVLDTAIRLCKIVASDHQNSHYFLTHQPEINDHLKKRPQDLEGIEAKYLYWTFFAPSQPGFRKWQLDSQTIIDTIHKAGGVVIVPHPTFRHKPNGIEPVRLLNTLFDLGIDGIEGWDADLLDKELARHALAKGKIVVGGSGRDATYYSNRILGKGDVDKQRMYISPRRLEDIKEYKQKHNLVSYPSFR